MKAEPGLTGRQMIAFKIGARARKFALEDCLIEGYEYLYGCLAEAQAEDPELHALLLTELAKFEKRVASLEAEVDPHSTDERHTDERHTDERHDERHKA